MPTDPSPRTRAEALIDAYLHDVVRRLDRSRRRDVAAELHSLLRDELDAATEAGAEPTTAARELLQRFGPPAEVAERYQPAPIVIEPRDARRFVRAAVGGVLAIWAVGLVAAVRSPGGDLPRALQTWWWGPGLGAFWWPGFLLACTAVAARRRNRRPGSEGWQARLDADRINRYGLGATLAFFILGTAVLISPATALDRVTGGRAAPAALDAFGYDPQLLRVRGPLLLVLLVANLVLLAAVVAAGRWTPTTRRISLWLGAATCTALVWTLLAGPVFAAGPTDRTAKSLTWLILLGYALDGGLRLYRARSRRALRAHPATSG